jgi:hypothetical protein
MNIFTYVNPWLDSGFAGVLPLTVFKGGGFGLSSNPKGQCWLRTLEARVGFEPTNGGFADLSLRPLGYRAETTKYSETGVYLSAARDRDPGNANREIGVPGATGCGDRTSPPARTRVKQE